MVPGKLNSARLGGLYSESREKVSVAERDRALGHRLQRHILRSYRNCEGLREWFRAAGVSPHHIKSVKDLERLPVMTKEDLAALQAAKPPFGGFVTTGIDTVDTMYVTSKPVLSVWGPERIRALVRQCLRSGYPKPGDVVLVSHEYHLVPGGLPLTDALRMMGCIVVPTGTGQLELQVRLLHDLQADGLFADSSLAVTLLKKAEMCGYDIRKDLNLKYVWCGSDRHIQKLKRVLEQEYGLLVGDSYGTADVGPIGFCCGKNEGYHFEDDSCVVEIADLHTGRQVGPFELGQVVVTPFSSVYPLVRLGTGDLASYSGEPCPCGRPVPRITSIQGTIESHVRVKGRFVHLGRLNEVILESAKIANYRMIVTLAGHEDVTTMEIETTPGCNGQALVDSIYRKYRDAFKMELDEIRPLPKGTLPPDCERFLDRRWE